MLKNLKFYLVILLVSAVAVTVFPAWSQAAAYDYNLTQVGTGGVSQDSAGDFRINQPRLSFDADMNVWVLSRLSDISGIDQFRFRHEVLAGGVTVYKELYSQVYYPSGNTWSKTYSYNDLGNLPAGQHRIRVSLSVNGGGFSEVDSVDIEVAAPLSLYSYKGSFSGTGIQPAGSYAFEIVNGKTAFSANESVFILTKLSNINNTDNFRIRHQVLAGGSSLYRQLFSPLFSPNKAYWSLNHTWNEIGYLPAGSHVLVTSISVNNGNYIELERTAITVSQAAVHYSYEGTDTGLGLRTTGAYTWQIVDGKRTFDSNDNVYALTKLANIFNVNTFRIRHQVLAGGDRLYRELYSPSFSPAGNRWGVNHTWNNFGPLPPGDHVLTAAISVNGGAYQELERINIKIAGTLNRYSFRSTELGTGVVAAGGYSYDIVNPRSTFSQSENIYALTKISGISNVRTFRIKHQVLAGGTAVYRELFSPIFSPDLNHWSQTSTWNVFKPLPAGNHVIKTFISVDGGSYQELHSLPVTVN